MVGIEGLREDVEEVDEGTGEGEERVVGKFAVGDFVGPSTDLLFELARILERDGEEVADEEEVEEFLLDFGVHEYLVAHARD